MGITPQQLKEMQGRVGRPKRVPLPATEALTPAFGQRHRIVLGVDPSLRGTGFGVIAFEGREPHSLGYGVVECPSAWEVSRCLVKIAQSLRDAIKKWKPTVCVFEGLFFAQNIQTAIVMGEARGAGLVAVGEAGLEVYELAPRKIKQAVVGFGGAGKDAVARMVQRVLKLPEIPPDDAADALATALAFAQEHGRFSFSSPKRV